PPGYPFSKIDKTLKKLIVEKKPGHSVLQEINDESDAKSDLIWGKYRVDFKKNVDILKYLDLMKHMVGIVQKNHFNFLWQYNGRLQRFTPPEILDIWGDERYRNIGHEYVDKIKRLIAERRRIEAMIIVRHSTKDTDDAINIIRNANTVDEANRALADRFNLTLYQTKALTSMKISTLTKANLQQLKDRKEEIIKEIAEFNYKLKHIPERMFSDAERIRKKYTNNKLVRRAVIPKYRYMVNFINKSESGFFQCEDKVKLMTFLKRFDKAKRIDVMARPPGLSHLYHFNDSGAIVPDTKHDIFKEGKGKVIVSNNPLKYTVKLENGTICAIKGLYPIGAAYVGSRVVCIYKNGIVEDISTTKLPVRKSISALGNLTDIKYIFDSPAKEYFICHMSPKELNTIRIGKIKNRKGKLKWPIGKNYILGLYKLNQEIIIKLPKECISRLGVDHVRIESLKNFFGDGDRDNFILDIKKSLKKTKFFYEG
ncbi:MAG: hypothetical protein GY804_09515, partial [Alphaproteobacteria bacterium]|nr:hypothetical protein [Alphaproteobacteria bacterium]